MHLEAFEALYLCRVYHKIELPFHQKLIELLHQSHRSNAEKFRRYYEYYRQPLVFRQEYF